MQTYTFSNKLPTQIFLLHGLYALHIINVSPFTDLRSFIILINYQSDFIATAPLPLSHFDLWSSPCKQTQELNHL